MSDFDSDTDASSLAASSLQSGPAQSRTQTYSHTQSSSSQSPFHDPVAARQNDPSSAPTAGTRRPAPQPRSGAPNGSVSGRGSVSSSVGDASYSEDFDETESEGNYTSEFDDHDVDSSAQNSLGTSKGRGSIIQLPNAPASASGPAQSSNQHRQQQQYYGDHQNQHRMSDSTNAPSYMSSSRDSVTGGESDQDGFSEQDHSLNRPDHRRTLSEDEEADEDRDSVYLPPLDRFLPQHSSGASTMTGMTGTSGGSDPSMNGASQTSQSAFARSVNNASNLRSRVGSNIAHSRVNTFYGAPSSNSGGANTPSSGDVDSSSLSYMPTLGQQSIAGSAGPNGARQPASLFSSALSSQGRTQAPLLSIRSQASNDPRAFGSDAENSSGMSFINAPYGNGSQHLGAPMSGSRRDSRHASMVSYPLFGAGNHRLSTITTGSAVLGSGMAASIRSYDSRTGETGSQRSSSVRTGSYKAGSSSGRSMHSSIACKPFMSQRLKGEIYKPWLDNKKHLGKTVGKIIMYGAVILGFCLAAVITYTGYRSVRHPGKLCLVLDQQFDGTELDPSIWTHEVNLAGLQQGFEWNTNSPANTVIDNGVLYLVPTLTEDVIGADAILNDYTVNLTATNECTSGNGNSSSCYAHSNISESLIINPVQSARITTKNSVSIRYGKVEITCKMPTGDWLWPLIYMAPVDEDYGPFPASGLMNIVSARGNDADYRGEGVNFAYTDLHWGPFKELDRGYLTRGKIEQRRVYYNQEFRTWGLEWTPDYLWVYLSTRISKTLAVIFSKSMWALGDFPTTFQNFSEQLKPTNPWAGSEQNSAPFDKRFYLGIGLGVGSTTGWFQDGVGGKPWLDASVTAQYDFWQARDTWLPTWPSNHTSKGFGIERVRMWQRC